MDIKELYDMHNVVVRGPIIDDTDSVNKFFKLVLKDTFERNGLSALVVKFGRRDRR